VNGQHFEPRCNSNAHRWFAHLLLWILLAHITTVVHANDDPFGIWQSRWDYAMKMAAEVKKIRDANANPSLGELGEDVKDDTVAGIGNKPLSVLNSIYKVGEATKGRGIIEGLLALSKEYLSFALSRGLKGTGLEATIIGRVVTAEGIGRTLNAADGWLGYAGGFIGAFTQGPPDPAVGVTDDRGEAFFRRYRDNREPVFSPLEPDYPRPDHSPSPERPPTNTADQPVDAPERDPPTVALVIPGGDLPATPGASGEEQEPYASGPDLDPYRIGERSVPCGDDTPVRCAGSEEDPYHMRGRSVPCDDETAVRCADPEHRRAGAEREAHATTSKQFPDACLGELLYTHNCTVVYCKFFERIRFPGWIKADTGKCIEKISAQRRKNPRRGIFQD